MRRWKKKKKKKKDVDPGQFLIQSISTMIEVQLNLPKKSHKIYLPILSWNVCRVVCIVQLCAIVRGECRGFK